MYTYIYFKYSTQNLNPYWVTGFCDAESCFQIVIYKNPKMKLGWNVRLVFSIHLSVKDIDVLYLIQKYFGVGNVTLHDNAVYYQVVAIGDLLKVIEHFHLCPLKTQKYIDFFIVPKGISLYC